MYVFFLVLLSFLSCPLEGKEKNKTDDTDLINFSYEKPTSLSKITEDIAKLFGKTILIDKGISSQVSIITQGPVTKELAYELYLAALNQLGYSITETAYVSKIFSHKEIFSNLPAQKKFGNYLHTDEAMIYVLQLKNAEAKNIQTYLSSALGPGKAVELSSDLILLSGPESVVRSIVATVLILDKEVKSDGATYSFPIVNMLSTDLHKILIDLGVVGNQVEGFQSGFLIDEPRSNTLFVFGSLDFSNKIKDLISKIDIKQKSNKEKDYHILPLENTEAKKIASLLLQLKEKNSKNENNLSDESFIDELDEDESRSLTGDFDILSDEEGNNLIVFAGPRDFSVLKELIVKLDKRKAQFLFEIEILEVGDSFNFTFSPSSLLPADIIPGKLTLIEGWKSEKVFPILTAPQSESGIASPKEFSEKMNATAEDLILGVLIKDKFSVNGLTGVSPGALVQIMKTDASSRVVSSPFLMSLDGEMASLVVSDSKTYKVEEVSQGPTATQGTAGAIKRTKIEKENSEILLDLKGLLDSGTDLTLDLDLKVNSILAFNQQGLPVIGKKSIKQKISLASGQTVFASGFNTHEKYKTSSEVPLLGSLPILSLFFRYTKDVEKQGRVFIFITPHIVWGDQDLKTIYKKRLQERMSDIKILKDKNLL